MPRYPNQNEYQKKCKQMRLEFSPTASELELWSWLCEQPKKATYIKELIREDMRRKGVLESPLGEE